MDHDDDVEHLFSWLQTPELRYREFAGAREITDTVVAWQGRPPAVEPAADETSAPAEGEAQFAEEYPPVASHDAADPLLYGGDVVPEAARAPGDDADPEQITARGPAMFAPASPPAEPAAAPGSEVFALGPAGRASPRKAQAAEEPLVPPPLIQIPAPRLAPPPTVAPRTPAAAGGGLLGGAYRENGANGHAANGEAAGQTPPFEPQKRSARSLDAVFGRLSGTRDRRSLRERRHVSGSAPPDDRPR